MVSKHPLPSKGLARASFRLGCGRLPRVLTAVLSYRLDPGFLLEELQMARESPCSGKCIFVKQPKSLLHPNGSWRKVFSSCSKDCKCPKLPPDKAGKPGQIFTAFCKPKVNQDMTPPPPICAGASCQFTLDKNSVWQQDNPGCCPKGCACDWPPNPVDLGAVPGDHYSTDCRPQGVGDKKRKRVG